MRSWERRTEGTWDLVDDTGRALAGIALLGGSNHSAPMYRVTGDMVDEPTEFATLVAAQVFVEALAARRGPGGTR